MSEVQKPQTSTLVQLLAMSMEEIREFETMSILESINFRFIVAYRLLFVYLRFVSQQIQTHYFYA